MAQCTNHPQYKAIEHCEHCGASLCGICLWYAESGERLCQQCAQQRESAGHTVYSPEHYADGIEGTLTPPTAEVQNAPYRGNNVDLAGLVAACLGIMIFLYCVPCVNMFFPLLAMIIGLMALADAKRAINTKRTQILAGIGIAGGALVLLLGIAWFGLTLGLPFLMILIDALTQTP